MGLVIMTALGALAALGFAFYISHGINQLSEGTDKMKEISASVREGAMAYLKRQYLVVGGFVIVMVGVLSFMASKGYLTWFVPFAFTSGIFFSGLAGYIGMRTATASNARTAWAAKESLNKGLRVAFGSGTVMGMVVVGLGLLDLTIWYVILDWYYSTKLKLPEADVIRQMTSTMLTFGMGASTMALFARVGGGIFTKAADVGADLVGKVEAGIPEDDPRNPATIADNVGDNVGDVAGMGADLYESYVGSIVATMALGAAAYSQFGASLKSIMVPLAMATIGVICSILGTFLVKTGEDATQKQLLAALRKGVYGSTVMIMIASYFLVKFTVGEHVVYNFAGIPFYGVWIALMIGLIAGNVIGYFTEYYTSDHYKPTQDVSAQAQTGSATVIIAGLAVGMRSTAIPVFTVVIGTLCAYISAGGNVNVNLGLYGIGIAAVGMLSTLGITLATDAYGPVADNAGGCAEMAGLEPAVRERTDALDSLGNTTAATGKGFAIGSAALTALALLAAYHEEVVLAAEKFHLNYTMNLSIMNPKVICGLFLGGMLPYLFSAMTMQAVGRAAGKMVDEVRRQFREIAGIMEGTGKPDYASCVTISTKAAQAEMIMPSLTAILFPIAVGLFGGPEMVCALLAGATVSGFVMAVMMANAGGSWDNAKKYIEGGKFGGKGSPAHKAAVVGDTVGDPFKDTSGPSINILIKLMSMVSMVFAALVLNNHLF